MPNRRAQSLAESSLAKILLVVFFLLVLLTILAVFAYPRLKDVLGSLGFA